MSKGSNRRLTDEKTFGVNYDKIFGKQKIEDAKNKLARAMLDNAATTTGWDAGLSQDYNKALGKWFADRLGSRQQLRQFFGGKT